MADIDRHCAELARDSNLARGRVGSVLLIVSSVWIAGCVSVQPRSIDAQASTQLDGRSVTYVTRAKPSFAAMTAGKATFAVIGAVAAVSEGNSLIESNAIPDPAIDISLGLARLFERANHMTVVGPGVSAPADDAGRIAETARSRAEYVIDVRTVNWSLVYFPTNWTHYRVLYTTRARLIDTNSGKIVAEAACKQVPESDVGAPTYDELLANKASLLKRTLATYGKRCIESLGQAMVPQQMAESVQGAPNASPAGTAAPISIVSASSAGSTPERVAAASPSLRPLNAVRLDAASLATKTWRYAHREERFAFVELAFKSDGRIEARNMLSSTTGRYEVHDDMLCVTYESRGWGRNCYYVLDDGSDALKLRSLSIQRTVVFEVCTEVSCIPATRANIFQPS